MGVYRFVVAKVIPDFVKNESVNVGIIVSDHPHAKKYFGKFIKNFHPFFTRYPDFNIPALETIVESYRGEHLPDSDNFLENLSKNSYSQLQFTEPRVIISSDPKQAMDILYGK